MIARRRPRTAGGRRRARAAALLAALVALGTATATAANAQTSKRPGDAAARIASALRAGDYRRALAAEPRGAASAEIAVLLSRAERALGRVEAARLRLERASARAPMDFGLRAELARTAAELGDREAVARLTARARADREAGRAPGTDPRELAALAVLAHLGGEFKQANALFRRAVALAPPASAAAREANVAWGHLLLEKHATADAAECFRDALTGDPDDPDALVGRARVALDGAYDLPAVEEALRTALRVNPRHAGALAVRGEIALDLDDGAGVLEAIKRLRAIRPDDPAAAWLAAARDRLTDDRAGYEHERDAHLAARPDSGAFFARVAEALVRHRRYEDAREVAAHGLRVAPDDARVLASLGITLLRLGDEGEGLALLRRAFVADPYDQRTYNLLELYEKVIAVDYVTIDTGRLRFRVHKDAQMSTQLVVAPFLEATYEGYVERYGFRPQEPVTIELYADPRHFAVRTVGLPRLGVTAVCFGRVITAAAPERGRFNWGLVLAHELAHVFSLQLSYARVPRWLTEGLAERETARLQPEWRRRPLDPPEGGGPRTGVAGLDDLARAFARPSSNEEASAAYVAARLAAELLEERAGFSRLRAALSAMGRGVPARDAVGELLGGGASFDAELRHRVEEATVPTPAYRRAMADAYAALRAGAAARAEAALRRALELRPEAIAPLVLLAQVLAEAGRDDERVDLETRLLRAEPQDGALARRLAVEHARRGRIEEAAALAEIAIFIDPDDAEAHAARGRALAALGRKAEAAAALQRALTFGSADASAIRLLLQQLRGDS